MNTLEKLLVLRFVVAFLSLAMAIISMAVDWHVAAFVWAVSFGIHFGAGVSEWLEMRDDA